MRQGTGKRDNSKLGEGVEAKIRGSVSEWGKNKKVMYVLMYEAQYGQLLLPGGLSRTLGTLLTALTALSALNSLSVTQWL